MPDTQQNEARAMSDTIQYPTFDELEIGQQLLRHWGWRASAPKGAGASTLRPKTTRYSCFIRTGP